MKAIDQMTIEELLAAAGDPAVERDTYLYVDLNHQVCAIRKVDRETVPLDELYGLGYAHRFMRAAGGTGRPWHV